MHIDTMTGEWIHMYVLLLAGKFISSLLILSLVNYDFYYYFAFYTYYSYIYYAYDFLTEKTRIWGFHVKVALITEKGKKKKGSGQDEAGI